MTFLRGIAQIALVFCGFGVLCSGCADHRAWTETDDWYHPAEYRGVGGEATPLNPVPWAEVTPEARARAAQMLAQSAAAAISPDEVANYAGVPFDHQALRVYLVRAVCLNRHGHYFVRSDGRDLYVSHATLGRGPSPMMRQPLLVALPAEPRNAYVSCGQDE